MTTATVVAPIERLEDTTQVAYRPGIAGRALSTAAISLAITAGLLVAGLVLGSGIAMLLSVLSFAATCFLGMFAVYRECF